MSEQTFRRTLVALGMFWVIFVLLPMLEEGAGKLATALAPLVPDARVEVTIQLTDTATGRPVEGALVQISGDEGSRNVTADQQGRAIFASAVVGSIVRITAQKLDYDLLTAGPLPIPGRRAVRLDLGMRPNPGRRLYVGYSSAGADSGIALADAASLLPVPAPVGYGQLGSSPLLSIAPSPDGRRAYVLTADALRTYDAENGIMVRQATVLSPQGELSIDHDGRTLYAIAEWRQWKQQGLLGLRAIQPEMFSPRSELELPYDRILSRILLSPDGRRLYLGGEGHVSIQGAQVPMASLAVVDIGNEGQIQTLHYVETEDTVQDIVLTADGGTLYALMSGRLAAFDTRANMRPTATAPLDEALGAGQGVRLVYTESDDTACLVVSLDTGHVAVIDIASGSAFTIRMSRTPSYMLADDDRLYLADGASNAVLVYSLRSQTLLASIPAPGAPVVLALAP